MSADIAIHVAATLAGNEEGKYRETHNEGLRYNVNIVIT